MSSGSAATSTPKYMQNCDTYLRRRSFWRTKKNRPQKKIGKSGQSEKYSGSFVVFERGVNFRCFSDLLSKKKKDTKTSFKWHLVTRCIALPVTLNFRHRRIQKHAAYCGSRIVSCFPQDLGTRHEKHMISTLSCMSRLSMAHQPIQTILKGTTGLFTSKAFLEKKINSSSHPCPLLLLTRLLSL